MRLLHLNCKRLVTQLIYAYAKKVFLQYLRRQYMNGLNYFYPIIMLKKLLIYNYGMKFGYILWF